LALHEGTEAPMTSGIEASKNAETRRRKLLFRCWHRGMRELDLIMGRFAETTLDCLTSDELSELERLVELPDQDLLTWLIGEAEVPPEYDTPLFRKLRAFNRGRDAAS
jgi:antitoxin CptB